MAQGNLIRGLNAGDGGAGGDYFIEVASQNVDGTLDERIVGRSLDVSTTKQTLWDQGGNLTYLTADTQLFLSSTSASDTDVTLAIQGLNFAGVETTHIGTLNGQTQVAIGGLLFRVHAVIVISATTPIGEVYLAESDTLSGGIPVTASKIKSKIPLDIDEAAGEYASTNITHNGFFTVPDRKSAHALAMFPNTEKNCDILVDLRVRAQGGAWLSLNKVWVYQSSNPLLFIQTPRVGGMSDIELRVLSGNPNGAIEVNVQFILKSD